MAFPLGAELVAGGVAAGVAAAGNPVEVGGVASNAAPAAATDGQIKNLWLTQRGALNGALGILSTLNDNDLDSNGALVRGAANDGAYGELVVRGRVYNGSGWDRHRTPNVFKVVAAVTIVAGTGATIWTPAAGKKFRLMGYSLSSSAAASLIFGDNLVGTVIFRGPLLSLAGIDEQNRLGNGILSAAANNVLKLDVSAAATVTGTVWGTEE